MSTESRIEARDAKAAGGVVAEGWRERLERPLRYRTMALFHRAPALTVLVYEHDLRAALDALTAAQAREAGRDDYWNSHMALSEIVSLQGEYDALNGGGPGWRERWKKALADAEELVRVEP